MLNGFCPLANSLVFKFLRNQCMEAVFDGLFFLAGNRSSSKCFPTIRGSIGHDQLPGHQGGAGKSGEKPSVEVKQCPVQNKHSGSRTSGM